MKYIHIRNLEKFNPGYTDRTLIWCKIYFTMLNSNYEFELIDDVDKWRLIALIMLELQMKKPIPYDEKWLQHKISTNKRPIHLTIKVLHNFIEFVTDDLETRNDSVTQSRVDKNRIDKKDVLFPFLEIWAKYPNKDGKKQAERSFNSSVTTEQAWEDINKAIENYLKTDKVKKGFIKNGSTWFNNWKDWIYYTEPKKEKDPMDGYRFP